MEKYKYIGSSVITSGGITIKERDISSLNIRTIEVALKQKVIEKTKTLKNGD